MESSQTSTITFGKKDLVGKFEGVFLDNYDVLRQLGKGGYGKVYEVMNKKTKEIRACKHLSKLSIKNLEKFQREVEILRKADHPNIIKLYEIFESRHSIYLIMEECKGGEVFDRIIEHIQNKENENLKISVYDNIMEKIKDPNNIMEQNYITGEIINIPDNSESLDLFKINNITNTNNSNQTSNNNNNNNKILVKEEIKEK